MALQLVYTSAPKLLDAGRSGFGVVARSKNLPPLAANAIERFSKFANMQGTDRSRIVMAHRKVTIGNTRLHVLSRIRDSGSDHTGRTNHIAHHLIFSPLEIRQALAQRLTPADVLVQFAWLDRWEGAPKAYDGSADIQIGSFLPHYAATDRAAWAAATGEPLHSRLLASDGAPKSGALIIPDGLEMPQLLGEALAECQNPWEKTFTTSLEPTDELAELDWVIAYRSDASAISRVSSRAIFDISRPHDLPVPVEAVQPLPDLRSAASIQETPPTIHGQASPQHAYSLRPIHAQPNPATRREEPESRPTAVINTRRTGNGKLWAIIGGGIAALLLLFATALFLIGGGKAKREESVSQQQDPNTELISRLTKEGEIEVEAKKIPGLGFDSSTLKRLPDDISTLKARINELGALTADNGSPTAALETFEIATSGISELKNLPKGSLCQSLWESLAIIRKLHRGDTAPKTPTEALGDLKSSLQGGATLTEPVWIKQEGINRIYSILWEWKYISMVGELVDGKNSVTDKAIEQFMNSRKSGDQEMITDIQLKAIHDRLGADMLQKYAAKLRPELRKKYLLPEVKVKPENIAAAGTHAATIRDKPSSPSTPELADEEWCVADPNKGDNRSFLVNIPGSKILQAINKDGDLNQAYYSFDEEKPSPIGRMNDFDLSLTSDTISSTKKLPNKYIGKNLTIKYKESALRVYLGSWPSSITKEENLNASIKRESGKPVYTFTISGKALDEINEIRSKTIPEAKIQWNQSGNKKHDKFPAVEGSNQIVLRPQRAAAKEVENPDESVLKLLIDVMKSITAETSKAKKAKANPKGEDPEGLNIKLDESDHKAIWEKYGYDVIAENQSALDWLNARLAKEKDPSDSSAIVPTVSSVTRLMGDGELNHSEQSLLNILKEPRGKFYQPQNPKTITIYLYSEKAVVFNKTFNINPQP
jgi:hypothetical protein